MLFDEVQNKIGLPEGTSLEYKATLPPPSLLARIIAAFANTEGGWIIIGVRDGRTGLEINGISDEIPATSVIESALARLKPKPDINHDYFEVGDKQVYAVEVKKSSKTIFAENKSVFRRKGNEIYTDSNQENVEIPRESVQPPLIKQILEKINFQGVNTTEAQLGLLRQYQNLIKIVGNSSNIICPDISNVPYYYPQGRALIRLVFSSLADSFERYVIDLLIEIHYAQPNTLKSETPFTAKEILNCSSIAELITYIAKKKVGDLPKGNSKEFGKYIKNIAQIELFLPNEQAKADKLFEVRNLYIHSNGIVDEKFLRNTNIKSFTVGDEHMTSFEELCETFSFFLDVSNRIDGHAIHKYHLATTSI